jgi:hypothetical protein
MARRDRSTEGRREGSGRNRRSKKSKGFDHLTDDVERPQPPEPDGWRSMVVSGAAPRRTGAATITPNGWPGSERNGKLSQRVRLLSWSLLS